MMSLTTRRLITQFLLVLSAMVAFVLIGTQFNTAQAAPVAAADEITQIVSKAAEDVLTDVDATPRRTGPIAPTAPKMPVVPGVDQGGASSVNFSVNGKPSTTVTLILALTVLSVAPAILLMTTSFTKMIVVLSLTRNALGLATAPPNQVLTGIALFLTMFVMAPVFSEINTIALQPYLAGQFDATQAYEVGVVPLRDFMLANTRDDELKLMIGLSGQDAPAATTDVTLSTLIPAFVLSELKAAFIIALVIFIPFLVLDMLVAAALMSLGMMMVPPTIVSLPFKILLFVMVDGWALITTALVGSYA